MVAARVLHKHRISISLKKMFDRTCTNRIIILTTTNDIPSPVPKPHPLTRRNGLVNQVEFLGLAHTFVITEPSNDLCDQPAQKRYECLNGDEPTLLL